MIMNSPQPAPANVLFLAVLLLFAGSIHGTLAADEKDASKQAQKLGQEDSSTPLSLSTRVVLNDNRTMPLLGLGSALSGEQTYQAVRWALNEGYRLIDTAAEDSYGNEDTVGQAIRDATSSSSSSTLKRDDVFVTTKLWDSDHGFDETLEAFDESFQTLQLDAVDLYLIHSPFGGHLVETWDALVYLQQQHGNVVKSIGVSNFGIPHLQAIALDGRPVPAVNQIELHPLLYQHRKPLLEYCRQHGIQVQAFGSLLFGSQEFRQGKLLQSLVAQYNKTASQILLRWALQHQIAVIPKSTRHARIQENSQVFDFALSEDDMERLNHWGDSVVDQEDRFLYKEDWNWNPIDEAPVHLGETDYWPDFDLEGDDYAGDYPEEEEEDDSGDDEEEDEL